MFQSVIIGVILFSFLYISHHARNSCEEFKLESVQSTCGMDTNIPVLRNRRF